MAIIGWRNNWNGSKVSLFAPLPYFCVVSYYAVRLLLLKRASLRPLSTKRLVSPQPRLRENGEIRAFLAFEMLLLFHSCTFHSCLHIPFLCKNPLHILLFLCIFAAYDTRTPKWLVCRFVPSGRKWSNMEDRSTITSPVCVRMAFSPQASRFKQLPPC